jgi:hypothetical protein
MVPRRKSRLRPEEQLNPLKEIHMSIKSLFAGIENAEKSTAAWFEKAWIKIHGDAPAIVNVADRVLPYASLLLQTVVGAEAGAPAAAIVGKVMGQAQADLDVANAAIYDVGATPSVASSINAVSTNLSGLLTAGHITNPVSVSNVTKVVSELGTLVAAFPAPAAPVPAAA